MCPGPTREFPLYKRAAAAALLTVAAGLHLPPAPVHATPPAEVLAVPEQPPALPTWLRPVERPEPAQEMQLTQPAVANPAAEAKPSSKPGRAARRGRPPLPKPVEAYGTGDAAAAVAFAVNQIGDAYRRGASGPNTWDCSALTQASWARAGKRLPRTAAQQQREGRAVSRDQLRPGDLVFWGSPAYHVALYVGGGEVVAATKPATGVKRQKLWGHPSAYRRLVG